MKLTIFRIVQEQLNNILVHSMASHAIIGFTRIADEFILLITDNGAGYDMLNTKKGVGLINIKSRVELYDGTATITSKPGEGFQLKVVFPLKS